MVWPPESGTLLLHGPRFCNDAQVARAFSLRPRQPPQNKPAAEIYILSYSRFGQTEPPPGAGGRTSASKMSDEQVSPDSAFCSSEISKEATRKPCFSMRSRVRGNEAGKITAPPRASAFAACGSS